MEHGWIKGSCLTATAAGINSQQGQSCLLYMWRAMRLPMQQNKYSTSDGTFSSLEDLHAFPPLQHPESHHD